MKKIMDIFLSVLPLVVWFFRWIKLGGAPIYALQGLAGRGFQSSCAALQSRAIADPNRPQIPCRLARLHLEICSKRRLGVQRQDWTSRLLDAEFPGFLSSLGKAGDKGHHCLLKPIQRLRQRLIACCCLLANSIAIDFLHRNLIDQHISILRTRSPSFFQNRAYGNEKKIRQRQQPREV